MTSGIGLGLRQLISFITVVALSSCATTATFKTSKLVPSAQGEVRIKELDNGNYKVRVEVEHLAPPDRLSPSRKLYVVWAVADQGTYNIGILKTDDSMKGELEVESTYEARRIIVTAEDDGKATKKGKQVILKSKKF